MNKDFLFVLYPLSNLKVIKPTLDSIFSKNSLSRIKDGVIKVK